MLATLSEPTSGTATVCGHDVVREADAVRRAISLTGQFAALEDNLTDRENLLLMARLRGYGKAAAGLVVQPQLLVLDEPTTGLDPRSRQVVWSTVRDLVDDGVTVLLTTQYLEEADALADDIVLIDHGQTVAAGSPSDLKARVATSTDFSSGVVDRFRSLPVTRMSVISAQVIGQIIEQILGIAIVAGVGLALGCRCHSWPARSCRSPA